MECTQPLKVQFPKKTYMNSEITVPIPKSGDMVKRVRIVISVTTPNTLEENIIRECELLQNGKTIEKLYGDFLHVDNLLKTPIEKRDTLYKLLCKNSAGVVYLHIPFKQFFLNADTEIRILFGPGNSEVNGYLLVDYALISKPPNFPFFQKVRQVQKLSVVSDSEKQITIDTYLVGPIYELYFTVTSSAGNLVDMIKNIKLLNGVEERFNLSGDYLRLVEPMKSHGRISPEPVYVYSFALDPENEFSNGETYLHDKQRFIIDLYENKDRYLITIYAQNHTFYYATESNTTPVFESTELIVSSTTNPSTEYIQIPIKTSYTNYANTITVSYTSDYEIENVVVSSDIPNYTISQNEINFNGIDSINGTYYANVTYSSRGFSNITCTYNFKGSNLMKVSNTSSIIYIDGAQRFYKNITTRDVNGTMLCNSNGYIRTGDTIFVNEYRDYMVKFGNFQNNNPIRFFNADRTYVDIDTGLEFTLVKYTPDFFIKYIICADITWYCSRYDIDIVCFTSPCYYSSIKIPNTIPNTNGTAYILNIKNDTFNFINRINYASIKKVCIDSTNNFYVTGFSSSSSISINDSTNINVGNGLKTFLIKFDQFGMMKYYKIIDNNSYGITSVELGENDTIFFCSSVSSSNVYSSEGSVLNISNNTNGYAFFKFDTHGNTIWSKQIYGIGSLTISETKITFNKYFNTVYLNVGCGNDSVPYIYGNDNNELQIIPSSIELIFKIDILGNIKWVVSMTTTNNSYFYVGKLFNIDQCSGDIVFTGLFSDYGDLKVYLNGALSYANDNVMSVILNFDTSGNITNSKQPKIQLSDFFSVTKDPYYTPLYDGTYFQPINLPTFNLYGNYGLTLSGNTYIQYASPTYINNVFVSGSYSSSPLILKDIILSNSTSSYDAFVTRINNNGTSIWASKIYNCNLVSTTSETNSNCYISGVFTGTVSVYNSDNVIYKSLSKTGSALNDGIIIKYDFYGNVKWCSNITSSTGFLNISNFDKLFLTGDSNGTLRIFNSDGTQYTSNTTTVRSVFVTKYDMNGKCSWLSRLIPTTTCRLVYSSSSLLNTTIINGYYTGTLSCYNYDGSLFGTLSNYGSSLHGFICNYNYIGNITKSFIFMYPVSPSYSKCVYSLDSSFYYICGVYTTPSTIYNSDGSTYASLPQPELRDGYIIKYNIDGFVQWYALVKGNKDDGVLSMAVDSFNSVYSAGLFESDILTIYNADGSFYGTLERTTNENYIFLIRYNQNGRVELALKIRGPTNYDFTKGIALTVDDSDNLYIGGFFNVGTITAYNTDGTVFGTYSSSPSIVVKNTLENSGSSDTFVTKYNTNGTAQWAARIAGTGYEYGYGTSVDSNGNMYVTGYYSSLNSLTIYNSDGNPSGITLPSNIPDEYDCFVVKYNTNGTAQWAARIVGANGNDDGYGISVDSNGNVYVTGFYFSNPLTIYNSNGTSSGITLPNSGGSDTFIVKYNTNGTAQWAARVGDTSYDYGYGISVDSNGNVYVTGFYSSLNPLTIYNSDGNPSGITLPSNIPDEDDCFVVKYNTNGTAQWAARIAEDYGNEHGHGISVDSNGNVYVTGFYYSYLLTIYNSDGNPSGITLPNSGGYHCFVVKYNTNGTAQWAARMANSDGDYGNGISVDSNGNVYVTGIYTTNPLTIYNSDGNPSGITLTTSGGYNIYSFVVKYNTNGTAQWAARIGDTGYNQGNGISVDSNGNVYVTGYYTNPLTIYNSDGTYLTKSISPTNGFLLKYS